jgi:hypothetical protein
VIPVQAKGGKDQIVIVQTTQAVSLVGKLARRPKIRIYQNQIVVVEPGGIEPPTS